MKTLAKRNRYKIQSFIKYFGLAVIILFISNQTHAQVKNKSGSKSSGQVKMICGNFSHNHLIPTGPDCDPSPNPFLSDTDDSSNSSSNSSPANTQKKIFIPFEVSDTPSISDESSTTTQTTPPNAPIKNKVDTTYSNPYVNSPYYNPYPLPYYDQAALKAVERQENLDQVREIARLANSDFERSVESYGHSQHDYYNAQSTLQTQLSGQPKEDDLLSSLYTDFGGETYTTDIKGHLTSRTKSYVMELEGENKLLKQARKGIKIAKGLDYVSAAVSGELTEKLSKEVAKKAAEKAVEKAIASAFGRTAGAVAGGSVTVVIEAMTPSPIFDDTPSVIQMNHRASALYNGVLKINKQYGGDFLDYRNFINREGIKGLPVEETLKQYKAYRNGFYDASSKNTKKK